MTHSDNASKSCGNELASSFFRMRSPPQQTAPPLSVHTGLNRRHFLLKMLPKHSIGAEIGVHKGDFSSQIMRVVNPRKLHLIDPWKHQESVIYKDALYGGRALGGQMEMDSRYTAVRERFKSSLISGQIAIHRGFSADVLKAFPDNYFDWIYIDGNHRYEYVKQDLQLAFAKTKPNGYITGDDYALDGWWGGDVKLAVDEFIQRDSSYLVSIKSRQFILKKGP